ncbi:unnamed protein product [Musa textilis]
MCVGKEMQRFVVRAELLCRPAGLPRAPPPLFPGVRLRAARRAPDPLPCPAFPPPPPPPPIPRWRSSSAPSPTTFLCPPRPRRSNSLSPLRPRCGKEIESNGAVSEGAALRFA